MKMESSFKNLPFFRKAIYLEMVIGVPITMLILFFILLLILELDDPEYLIIPIFFGLVTPAFVMKDFLNPKKITITDESIKLEKRFGGDTEIDFGDLKSVASYEKGGRLVIMFMSRKPRRVINVSDWYPYDKKENLLSHMKRSVEGREFEYKEFNDKKAMMNYVLSLDKSPPLAFLYYP